VASGKRKRLSRPRRLIGDLLHFAKQIPTIPVQRRMKLAPLQFARQRCAVRPRWVTLFAAGFAKLAARESRLRQSYLKFPFPHLYEHPESIAAIAVEREWRGEEAVFFGKLYAPDKQPIALLDQHMNYFKEAPFDEIEEFYLGMFVSRLPQPIRRLGWWCALNMFGDLRGRVFGTFGVSVYSGLGAESLHPISPLTTVLNFGVIEENGQVDVRLIYDHRVLDGAYVARILGQLEEVLNTEIVTDLGVPLLRIAV
jgi:hypothetical protein